MTINERKTQIMCFNFRKSLEFPPIFRIGNGIQLDIVDHAKLLGVVISSDLKWSRHVDYMCRRASSKIWILRRMRILGLDQELLLDFYCKEVRSILEFGAPCWNSGLTTKLVAQIERIQKISINIILCDSEWEIPYTVGCTILGIEPLHFRRHELCVRFAQKTLSDQQHSDFFSLNSTSANTRNKNLKFREFVCHTTRFYLLSNQNIEQNKTMTQFFSLRRAELYTIHAMKKPA